MAVSEDLVPALRALAAKELWQNALDFFFEELNGRRWAEACDSPGNMMGLWHKVVPQVVSVQLVQISTITFGLIRGLYL